MSELEPLEWQKDSEARRQATGVHRHYMVWAVMSQYGSPAWRLRVTHLHNGHMREIMCRELAVAVGAAQFLEWSHDTADIDYGYLGDAVNAALKHARDMRVV